MPGPTRRTLIATAACAAPLWPALAQAQDHRPLPIPPLIDARANGGAVHLTAQPGATRFVDHQASPTAGFNGGFLGPTVRLHSGDSVQMTIENRLSEDTTVHWHGLMVPAAVDGGPHNNIAPGAAWRPVLAIDQPASTLWYHAHPHPRTGAQVYAGLAGMMIVTDAEEQALKLPSDYGVDDIPLILQDRRLDAAGRLVYPTDRPSMMMGVRGNAILANGAAGASAAVPRGLVRLRLLNGANARLFHLSFDDGRAFHWIATDGGLLRAPVKMTRLTLAPAQRAEILVDFSDGRACRLMTEADDNLPMMGMGGRGGGMMGPMAGLAGAGAVVHFAPRGAAGPVRIPTVLAKWTRPNAARAVRARRLKLDMGMGGMGGMRGMGGRPGGAGHGPMGLHGIDGRPFDMARIDHRVRLGDVEIWEVSADMMKHPFHMHGVHFEVLSRGGKPPALTDQGRRDTVLVEEPVALIAHFTQPAPKAPFMYHCHILEHEDQGMMGQYLTT